MISYLRECDCAELRVVPGPQTGLAVAMTEPSEPSPSPAPEAPQATPGDGQLIVPGEAGAPKRKRIKLLNRTPSPVILDDYGELEPARCTVGGPGVAGGIVGVGTHVSVRARDANGIGIREGGQAFTLRLQHTSTGSQEKTYSSTDNGDGTYTFSGVRADLKGMHKVCLPNFPTPAQPRGCLPYPAPRSSTQHVTSLHGAQAARAYNARTNGRCLRSAVRGGDRLACR